MAWLLTPARAQDCIGDGSREALVQLLKALVAHAEGWKPVANPSRGVAPAAKSAEPKVPGEPEKKKPKKVAKAKPAAKEPAPGAAAAAAASRAAAGTAGAAAAKEGPGAPAKRQRTSPQPASQAPGKPAPKVIGGSEVKARVDGIGVSAKHARGPFLEAVAQGVVNEDALRIYECAPSRLLLN